MVQVVHDAIQCTTLKDPGHYWEWRDGAVIFHVAFRTLFVNRHDVSYYSFQSLGRDPSCSDLLKILHKEGKQSLRQSL